MITILIIIIMVMIITINRTTITITKTKTANGVGEVSEFQLLHIDVYWGSGIYDVIGFQFRWVSVSL